MSDISCTSDLRYDAVVIGVSAGGLKALRTILPALSPYFPVPVLVVQHLSPQADDFLARFLNEISQVKVKEADEKEPLLPGTVYLAPPNYHLLVETDKTLSLSVEGRVNYARPSIDVLFLTASEAFGARLIGLVLTGANDDGSRGLKRIKQRGGLALVQDPATADADHMPRAAITAANPDAIIPLQEIAAFLECAVYGIEHCPGKQQSPPDPA